MRLNVVVELIEFFTESSNLLDVSQILQLPVLCDLVLDAHVSVVGPFFVFLVPLAVDVLGDFVEIVLSSMRDIDVRILLFSYLPLLLDSWSSRRLLFLLVLFLFFLVARRWLGVFEVEAVLIVSVLDFVVEGLRPVVVVVDILAELLVGEGEGRTALPFDVLLVAADDGIMDEVRFLRRLDLFLADGFPVPYELGLVLLVLLEVLGVEGLDRSHLLDGVYLSQFVNKLEAGLVTHYNYLYR